MFSFLKHGVVISARRCGLFLRVFALNVALSTALFLFKILVAPLMESGGYSARIEDDAVAASTVDDAEFSFSRVCLPPIAYLVLYLAVGLVRKVATASAAVTAYSGERHTFGSFLRKVRGNLLGGSATVVFGLILRTACASAIAASILALPALVFWGYSRQLFLLDALFAVLAFQFYFYLDVVCTMAVVASVAAEPGRRRGALGAVARAWRAMAGTSGRAFLYAVLTLSLGVAVRSVSNLAVSRLPHGMDKFVVSMVDGSIEYVLHFVVEVFSVVAITAYYFECRNRKEDRAGHTD
jgi:hypothetical protein